MMSSDRCCPQCGAGFACKGDACWCLHLPAILPPDPTSTCLCPDCLARRLAMEIERRLQHLSHAEALELARPERRKSPPVEHLDYTMEEDKLVFTAWYLLKRGRCCGESCRHCPYPESERPPERSCRTRKSRAS